MGEKGKSIFRARASEIPSVDFEKEESNLIINARSSKINQGTRSVGMSTRNTLRE